MKTGDLKKPLNAEIPAYKTVCFHAKFFFLILFFTAEAAGQIPFNGFCRFDSFSVVSGYTSLLPINYNSDEFTDLLLTNTQSSSGYLLKGSRGNFFEGGARINLPYPVDKLILLSDVFSNPEGYAVISQKRKSVGFLNLSGRGDYSLIREKKFPSVPHTVVSADIDGDAEKELLISGASFNGLAVIDPKGKTTKETVLSSSESFSGAVFADLNNDGSPDIAAYSPISGIIRFFYNNGRGIFAEVRSFPGNNEIYTIASSDLNGDLYTDIYTTGSGGITVYYGDGTNAFTHQVEIKIDSRIIKSIHADLNDDGKTDIAVLSGNKRTIEVFFQKEDGTFFPPWIITPGKELWDIAPFYTNFNKGIAALNKSGTVFIFSLLGNLNENRKVILPFRTSLVSSFDFTGNGTADIIITDTVKNTVTVLFRNNAGIPVLSSQVELFDRVSAVTPVVQTREGYCFYLWRPGGRSIREITVNPFSFSLKQQVYYTNTPLQYVTTVFGTEKKVQLAVISGEDKKYKIEGLSVANGFLQLVYSAPFTVKSQPIEVIPSQIMNDGKGGLYSSVVISDSVLLFRVSMETGSVHQTRKFSLKEKPSLLFAGDLLNNDSPCAVVLSEENGKSYFNLLSPVYKRRFKSESTLAYSLLQSAKYLQLQNGSGGLKRFYILDTEQRLSVLLPVQRRRTMFVFPSAYKAQGTSGLLLLPAPGNNIAVIRAHKGSTIYDYEIPVENTVSSSGGKK